MDADPTAPPSLTCHRCGTALVARGVVSGAWLRCPGCGQPVQFFPPPRVEPRRVESGPGSGPESALTTGLSPIGSPWIEPRQRASRGPGCTHLVLLAALAGFAQALFVGGYLGMTRPPDLAASWLFGVALAWVVATLAGAPRSRADW